MSKQNTTSTGRRSVRLVDRLLTVGGMFVVVAQATILAVNPYELSPLSMRGQLLVLVVGLAINQIGLWSLSHRVFSERRYLALRRETDRFIDLVRQLNRQAVDGDQEAMQQTVESMHTSVDSMESLAGVLDLPALERAVGAEGRPAASAG